MELKVLLYERQKERLALPDAEALQLTGVTLNVSHATTRHEFRLAIRSGAYDLVVSAGSLAFTALEDGAAAGTDIPFLVLLEQDDADVRRRALCAGAWQTAPLTQPEVVTAVLGKTIFHLNAIRQRGRLEKALTHAEDALQKSQKSMALGVMLGSIAHEISNPLEGLANLLYLARRSLNDRQFVENVLDMAESELSRVSAISKQMLSFHRDTATPVEVRTTELLDGVLTLFSAALREKNITVVRQYDHPGRMLAHPGELRQVFANLLSNALDAMDTGGKLVLRVRERAGSQHRLYVSVADSGKGIPQALRKNIGNLFFTTKGEAGTGYGVWVVRRIVKKYGGSLQVSSSALPGRSGTVFLLCFGQPHVLMSGSTLTHAERAPSQGSANAGTGDAQRAGRSA